MSLEKIDLDSIIGCPGYEGVLGQRMPGDHHFRTYYSHHVPTPDSRPVIVRAINSGESVADTVEGLASAAHGEGSVTDHDLTSFALLHGLRGTGDELVDYHREEY